MSDERDDAPSEISSTSTPEKRKRGRPPTGQARSRATIQREYRQRKNSNVTKSTVELLDENMALRKNLIEALDELDAMKVRVRVEYELGEKARERVRLLEKQLAARGGDLAQKAASSPRYVLQYLCDQTNTWTDLTNSSNKVWDFKTQKEVRAYLTRQARTIDPNRDRVIDKKTGELITL